MKLSHLAHKFVEYIPEHIEPGTLYVSIAYATATHKCCCGCGREVVTPLSPTDWALIYDGQTVSLDPSVGNWSFPCRSHYWIRRNRVVWARRWSKAEIEEGRKEDRAAKTAYFEAADREAVDPVQNEGGIRKKRGLSSRRRKRR
jgi:hypothetical protein